MIRKRFVFFYALSLYSLISLILTSAQFFAAGTLVYLFIQGAQLPVFPALPQLSRAMFYDSAGFAFLTSTGTVLQYYLSSLLHRELRDRGAAFGVVLLSAILSAAFFLRLSAGSVFGAYAFAGAPLIFACLLGAWPVCCRKKRRIPFTAQRSGYSA